MGLVLSRKCGQTIEVDGPATFQVVAIEGSKTRIKVVADRSVTIDRGEVAAAKRAEDGPAISEERTTTDA